MKKFFHKKKLSLSASFLPSDFCKNVANAKSSGTLHGGGFDCRDGTIGSLEWEGEGVWNKVQCKVKAENSQIQNN